MRPCKFDGFRSSAVYNKYQYFSAALAAFLVQQWSTRGALTVSRKIEVYT